MKNNELYMRSDPASLPGLLTSVINEFPDRGVGFVHSDRSITFLNFPELERKALALLAGLQEQNIGCGDKVILSLSRSEDILPVLWACFIGGIIPALLQPPVSFTEVNPAAEKIERVFHLLNSPRIITSGMLIERWKSEKIPGGSYLDVSVLHGNPGQAIRASVGSSDIAFIQFSSGSTGEPKGIVLTHKNLLVNTFDISYRIDLAHTDITVNWMPLYHDMGLIGFHLTPMRAGMTQYFIDPVDFIKHPSLWPDIITLKRCTITASPNFGQMLMNRYLSRRKDLKWDLSSVRILFNGAEPISVATMLRFLHEMEPYKMDPKCMFPVYGLAEATLAVTFPPIHQEAIVKRFHRNELLKGYAKECVPDLHKGVVELVDLGSPLPHVTVQITDDHHQELGEGRIGNILVRGESCCSGYFGNPSGNAGLFHAEWMMTGDLGFIHQGSLFVTGRKKDIIFINGVNFYAHDLETVALKANPALEGKLVIAGVFDEKEGRDRLLVFLAANPGEPAHSLCREVRACLSAAVGLSPDTFVLIRSADIPRTSSGKIQRYKMVDRYSRGGFENILRI